MSVKNFTKGEWYAHGTTVGVMILNDKEFDELCDFYALGRDYEETHANALLTAAAPDLLEACQMFIDILEEEIGFDSRFQTAWEKGFSAIAKAKLKNAEIT